PLPKLFGFSIGPHVPTHSRHMAAEPTGPTIAGLSRRRPARRQHDSPACACPFFLLSRPVAILACRRHRCWCQETWGRARRRSTERGRSTCLASSRSWAAACGRLLFLSWPERERHSVRLRHGWREAPHRLPHEQRYFDGNELTTRNAHRAEETADFQNNLR